MKVSKKIFVVGLGLMSLLSAQSFALHTVYFQFRHLKATASEIPEKGKVTMHVKVGLQEGMLYVGTLPKGLILDGFYQDHLHQIFTQIPLGPYSVEIRCLATQMDGYQQQTSKTMPLHLVTYNTREVDISASCPVKGSTLLAPEDIQITRKSA